MKSTLSILAFTIMAVSSTCNKPVLYDLAIKNVDVFDSEKGEILKNKTILINADSVVSVVPASQQTNTRNETEGHGRLVVPGFIDTHTHLTDIIGDYDNAPEYIPRDSLGIYRGLLSTTYLNYGVTTVAEMGQPEKWMEASLEWQKNPDPAFPNLFISGGALISDEERKPYINHAELLNPEDAEDKVQKYYDKGLRQIKLYWRMRRPEMEAAAEKARSLDMEIFAHVDNNIMSIEDALSLGIKNFEHASTISASVFRFSDHGDSLGKIMQNHYPGIQSYMPFALEKFQFVEDHPELHRKRDELIKKMADQGATISTTIHLFGSFCRRTYFNSYIESYYTDETPELNESQLIRLNTAFDTYMSYIKEAYDRGVKFRIGTDCKNGGKAILSEMLLLHEFGFPMKDILQIATFNGATALNIDKDHGSIKSGKKADLVIFEKSPFNDPENLLSEKIIIKGGKVYEKK